MATNGVCDVSGAWNGELVSLDDDDIFERGHGLIWGIGRREGGCRTGWADREETLLLLRQSMTWNSVLSGEYCCFVRDDVMSFGGEVDGES